MREKLVEAERLKKLCWCCEEDSGFVYPVCYVESPATLCAVAQALTPHHPTWMGWELSSACWHHFPAETLSLALLSTVQMP